MTTIAYDGVTLAVDTRMSNTRSTDDVCGQCGENVSESYSQIVKMTSYLGKEVMFKGSKVVASARAGTKSSSHGLDHLLSVGKLDEEGFSLVVNFESDNTVIPYGSLTILTETGFWFVYTRDNELKIKEETKFPWEAGSGGYAAMTAMCYLGLDAVKAIALTSTIDISTGGDIHAMTRLESGEFVYSITPIVDLLPQIETLENKFIKGKQ